MLPVDPTQVLEEHELGDDVAVADRRRVYDRALFRKAAGDTIQRFVGKLIGREAALVAEVPDEPAPHLEVSFAPRIGALVEPREEAMERLGGRLPGFLQPWISNDAILHPDSQPKVKGRVMLHRAIPVESMRRHRAIRRRV